MVINGILFPLIDCQSDAQNAIHPIGIKGKNDLPTNYLIKGLVDVGKVFK